MHIHVRYSRLIGLLALAAGCKDGSLTSPAASSSRHVATPGMESMRVTPGQASGWVVQGTGASSASFAATFASNIGKTGAQRDYAGGVRLEVGTRPVDGALVRTERFAGTPLSELTALGFSTYVVQRGQEDGTPFLTIAIDLDGDSYVDDQLLFRPAPVLGQWQTWDALNGAWWSNSTIGSPDAQGLRTLAAYRAAAPSARLTSAVTLGAWGVKGAQPLVAVVDRLLIGISGRSMSFQFGLPTAGRE